MQAEFTTKLDERGQITLPIEVAKEVPRGEDLHIVVSWQPYDEDAAWTDASMVKLAQAWHEDEPEVEVIRG